MNTGNNSQQQASVGNAMPFDEFFREAAKGEYEALPHWVRCRIEKAETELSRLTLERDAAMGNLHDEITANLAFREAGGAKPDEDMPTFCARLIAERDALKAEAEALRKLLIEADAELDCWDDGKKGRRCFDLETRIDAAIAAQQGEKE